MPTGVYKRKKGIRKGITFNTDRTHFKKGHIPWMKGRKGLQPWHNVSGLKAGGWNKGKKLGFIPSGAFKKGHKMPEEIRQKIREKMKEIQKGENNSRWNGGKCKSGGYWRIYQPNHPKANKNYIKQAILVAEKCLGRYLNKEEIIHHMGAKNDDRPKMLYLFPTRGKHTTYEKLKNKPILKSNLV